MLRSTAHTRDLQPCELASLPLTIDASVEGLDLRMTFGHFARICLIGKFV